MQRTGNLKITMEDDAGDLMINLSNAGKTDFTLREKITGNRGQRIRARKAIKLQKNTENERKGKSASYMTENEELQEVKGHTPSDHPNVVQKSKGAVISSLFNRNPEIPRVPKTPVKTVKEEVFSADSFNSLRLHPYMISNLEGKMGLKQMTSVQRKSIPVILRGRDVLIKSQTGSGKTLAYAIPVVQSLQSLPRKIQRSDGPYAILLVPTRELALQSQATFNKLLQPFVWIVSGCIIGGEKRKAEKARLRKGINIVIATPGRLLDHIEHTHCLDFSQVCFVVLDEADRLLDMGYERDVAKIITALNERCHQSRQTILLSATLTQGVERLAGITLESPERVSVTEWDEKSSQDKTGLVKSGNIVEETLAVSRAVSEEDSFSVPDQLKQQYVIVPCKLRLVTLASLILCKCKFSSAKNKMIVFLTTQDSVEFHYQIFEATINGRNSLQIDSGMDSDGSDVPSCFGRLSQENVHAVQFFKLHGEMLQKDRTRVYQQFSQAQSGVLLCTDVAARGLDLPNVRWIVQFSSPGGCAEYVHRVGRTARAGSRGHGVLFLMPDEVEYIKILRRQNISLTELSMEDILKSLLIHARDVPRSRGGLPEVAGTYQEAATLFQLRMEEDVQGNEELLQQAQKAYQSFVKAYATYPANLKSIFHVRNLHLGHLAKSFALRETPKDIGIGFSKFMAASKHKRRRDQKKISFQDDRPSKKRKRVSMSEFASGSISKAKPFSGPGVGKRRKGK